LNINASCLHAANGHFAVSETWACFPHCCLHCLAPNLSHVLAKALPIPLSPNSPNLAQTGSVHRHRWVCLCVYESAQQCSLNPAALLVGCPTAYGSACVGSLPPVREAGADPAKLLVCVGTGADLDCRELCITRYHITSDPTSWDTPWHMW